MEENISMILFCEWLRTALAEAGMSQHALSEITGMTESMISKIINNKYVPSGTTILRILDVFDAHMEIVPNRTFAAGAEEEEMGC